MKTIKKLKEIHKTFSESNAYSSTDVDSFFDRILRFISEEFDSSVSYFCSLNRVPEEYEHKIEKIYKTKDKNTVENFPWWGKDDHTYLPLLKKYNEQIKFYYQALNFEFLPPFSSYVLIKKEEYIRILEKSLSINEIDEGIIISKKESIQQNFADFSNNILIINIGIQDDSDGVLILDFINKSDIDERAITSVIHLLNAITINYLLNVKKHRELFISKFNIAISELNISSNYYIEGIIEALAMFFEGKDEKTHCTEMGIFERFANRIDINSTNFRSFYEEDDVLTELGTKPLIIGAKQTLIDYVAFEKKPYYVESINNPKHQELYRQVIKATMSQLTIPLVFQDQLLGVLNIGVDIENGFLPYDRKLLISLGQIIALILNQKKMFLFQKIITERFINKILLIKNDDNLKNEIEKTANHPDIIQNIFFDYMLPIHKCFVNYNLMLVQPKFTIVELNKTIDQVKDLIYNQSIFSEYIFEQLSLEYINEKDKNIKGIKDLISFEFNYSGDIKVLFYEDILKQVLFSIYIYSLDNCIRFMRQKGEKKFTISTLVGIENNKVIIEISNNGEFPKSEYLNERFTDIDYPKPIVIKDGFIKEYMGFPFLIIDYLFKKSYELKVFDNKDINSLKLFFPPTSDNCN